MKVGKLAETGVVAVGFGFVAELKPPQANCAKAMVKSAAVITIEINAGARRLLPVVCPQRSNLPVNEDLAAKMRASLFAILLVCILVIPQIQPEIGLFIRPQNVNGDDLAFLFLLEDRINHLQHERFHTAGGF